MVNEVGLSVISPPPGAREPRTFDAPVEPPLTPTDEVVESRGSDVRKALALGLMAAGSFVPAIAHAQDTRMLELRAVSKVETSEVADEGLDPAHNKGWRSFGHATRAKAWFDRAGNWADTHTAVTADQFAAMPVSQQKAFAARVGLKPDQIQSGVAERALRFAAVGRGVPGEVIDDNFSLGTEPDGSRHFGHRPVAGQLFREGRWRDTGTLVSADQAAAMAPEQQALLGEGLSFGDPSRVVIDVDRSQDDPRMAELASKKPNALISYQGHKMKPETALAWDRLTAKIGKQFPGREVRITATTEGRHSDPNHKLGGAMDFVVEPLSREESTLLEKLCWQSGFKPFNEYVHSSRFKTGDHMHVQLAKP